MKKQDILQKAITDPAVRKNLVRQSHEAFCSIYLTHHKTYPYAFFHKEMFKITESTDTKISIIMAFRGSGKSTILNLSNTIWSIIGTHQKKFVLIIGKTKIQSQAHFENIKYELEENELLKQDLGPFKTNTNEWGALSIELPLYNAKIMCIGSLQNIRGLKYKNQRPDLIICDDMEDILSVQENTDREKLYQWFLNEVLPIGDDKTNIFVLGNLLHRDSLMIRLKKLIMHGRLPGKYYCYPLLDNHNQILWPQRYSIDDILNIQKNLPKKRDNELKSIFERDYLLDLSYVAGTDLKHIDYPITNTAIKKEDFIIATPLWATGVLLSKDLKVDDPDGWDGVTVIPDRNKKQD